MELFDLSGLRPCEVHPGARHVPEFILCTCLLDALWQD